MKTYKVMNEAQFLAGEDARGLEIRREKLGVGELKLMDCRQFWEIGSALVQADPRIIIGVQ